MVPPPNKNQIDPSEFIEILIKVQDLIPIVKEIKREISDHNLILQGKESDGKTSLIREVRELQKQIEGKADKDKIESVFTVQEKEIKRQMEITENLPDLEKFINKLRSIPGMLMLLLLPVIITVIGNFFLNVILKFIPIK